MNKTYNLEKQRSLRNNDPLAHVYLMQDSYDGALARQRMQTEFVTDMGERLERQPFIQSYGFTLDSDEIIYDTGLRYLGSLRQSLAAAVVDVEKGDFSSYHRARQEAFLRQGENILSWANNSSEQSHLVVFSLCPTADELSFTEAKKQSFKPERLMASVQLHAMNNGIGETIAFSLDGLTLERLQKLLERLGNNCAVAETTLEQLSVPVAIKNEASPHDAVASIIKEYDDMCQEQTGQMYSQGIDVENNIVEANSFVLEYPESYNLYEQIVKEVAKSLNSSVTKDLAEIVHSNLTLQFHGRQMPDFLALNKGDYFSEQQAEELIEYLRRQAIPEYLTQKLSQKFETTRGNSSYTNDIGSAGATAIIAGRQYDGACPSSTLSNSIQNAKTQAEQFGLKQTVLYESPKAIMSKGDFDVLPIGSCPVCGAECGTGIKNRKSGRWYCTQKNCTEFRKDIYNFVFNIKEKTNTNFTNSKNRARQVATPLESTKRQSDLSLDLRQKQDQIWVLKHTLYSQELSDTEKDNIIEEIVKAHQAQQGLLRLSIGQVANDA